MKNCVILGAGRSGTSAMTRVLSLAGYWTGEQSYGQSKLNPYGFFEDKFINDLNNVALRPYLKLHAEPYPGASEWLSVLPEHVDVDAGLDVGQARMILSLRGDQPFAIKDPRFSYTLPLWEEVLPEETVRIVMIRDPMSMVNSMRRAEEEWRGIFSNRGEDYFLRVWCAMYSHILKNDRDHRYVYVGFNTLMSGNVLPKLGEILEANLTEGIDLEAVNMRPTTTTVPPKCQGIFKTLCDRAARHLTWATPSLPRLQPVEFDDYEPPDNNHRNPTETQQNPT